MIFARVASSEVIITFLFGFFHIQIDIYFTFELLLREVMKINRLEKLRKEEKSGFLPILTF